MPFGHRRHFTLSAVSHLNENGALGPLEQPLDAPSAGTATTKPPTTVANALESPGHHLDPTTVFAEAW